MDGWSDGWVDADSFQSAPPVQKKNTKNTMSRGSKELSSLLSSPLLSLPLLSSPPPLLSSPTELQLNVDERVTAGASLQTTACVCGCVCVCLYYCGSLWQRDKVMDVSVLFSLEINSLSLPLAVKNPFYYHAGAVHLCSVCVCVYVCGWQAHTCSVSCVQHVCMG